MAASWMSLPALVALVGEEAACALCREFGGLSLYIGKTPGADLVAVVGIEAAGVLSANFGGEEILLPSALVRAPSKKEKIIVLLEAGASQSEAARECQCTLRHVQGIASDLGIPNRDRRVPKKTKILALLRKGVAMPTVAAQVGVSLTYVRDLASQARRAST